MVYADAGYQGIAKRPEMEGKAIEFRVAMWPGKRRVLPETAEGRLLNLIEMAKVHTRKQQFGFQKTRLRGMAKKSMQGACALLGSPSITGADLKADWCVCLAESGLNRRGKDLETKWPVAGSSVRAQQKAQMEQLRVFGLSRRVLASASLAFSIWKLLYKKRLRVENCDLSFDHHMWLSGDFQESCHS